MMNVGLRNVCDTTRLTLLTITLTLSCFSTACHPADGRLDDSNSPIESTPDSFREADTGSTVDWNADVGEDAAEDIAVEVAEEVAVDIPVDVTADVSVDVTADVPVEVVQDTSPDPDATEPSGCDSGNFNFFVISLEAIQDAGGAEGLGGNLGGLAGADALCQSAANAVGACDKTWVAFLSVTDGGNGQPIHAIDRIGTGPWHDVNGLLLAEDIEGLLHDRPDGDDQTVVWDDGWNEWVFTDCLTTELGNCNHTYGDSHDILTGSNSQGRLYNTDPTYTCNDWTSTTNNRSCDGTRNTCWPAIGHSWPAHSGQGWIYSHNAGGCQRNINLSDSFENGVGGHGGYGAFYCFGLSNP